LKILGAVLTVAGALGLLMDRPAIYGVHIPLQAAADQEPRSPRGGPDHREGALRFEVEPGDVEIYLDDQYLGRAGELLGRPIEGVVAGNRLLELRRGADRTFLQIVVPPDGTKTIRVNLAAPVAPGSPSSPLGSRPTEERRPTSTLQAPAPSKAPGSIP
jgi:hypothetical protein